MQATAARAWQRAHGETSRQEEPQAKRRIGRANQSHESEKSSTVLPLASVSQQRTDRVSG